MRLFKFPAVMTSTARRSLPYRALMNQLVCLVATLLFWLLTYRDRKLVDVALYSFAIGNLIWLFIDGGRALLTRLLNTPNGRWPGWPAMAANIVLGTVGGYVAGTAGVAWLLGHPLGLLVPSASSAVLSLLTAVVATYFFYSRERLHLEMAAAEAARRQALESQLSLLQSQLEPHMLFNTLANLRVLIGLDPARAQAMLDHLIGFLRVTLAASRVPRHPLAAEFARLDDYLALMAIRMGERLQVQLDLPAELADIAVPPLLLQPLVENSIKHGLEPQVAGGRIHVSARREGDELVLEVRDSGVGLAAWAQAPQWADGTHAPHTGQRPGQPRDARLVDHASQGGFGLTGVRERLAALFGPAASLTLGAACSTSACGTGSGALATLRLPIGTAPPGAVASTRLPASQ